MRGIDMSDKPIHVFKQVSGEIITEVLNGMGNYFSNIFQNPYNFISFLSVIFLSIFNGKFGNSEKDLLRF